MNEKSAAILPFHPRVNPNTRILDRIHGLPAQPGTSDTDADPRNPKARNDVDAG